MKLLHGAVVAAGTTLWLGSAASAQPNFWSFDERTRMYAITPDGTSAVYHDGAGRVLRYSVNDHTSQVISSFIPFFNSGAMSADLDTWLGAVPFDPLNAGPARWTAQSGYQLLIEDAGRATSASGTGQTVAGMLFRSLGPVAFRWTPATGVVELPNLTPPASATVNGSVAHQVSRDGSTIAGYTEVLTPDRFNRVPTVWRNGTPQALPIPPEANLAFTSRLSADGQRIVGATAPNSSIGNEPVARMLFWDAANQYEVIPLPTGWRYIEILGGTADLSTIVGSLSDGPNVRGFLWRRDLGFVLADDLLATIGVTRPDWEFNDIRSISDDGRTIVGTARLAIGNPFQEEIAWVATIPTPGAAALLTLAGLWTARRRRGAAGAPNQSPEA
ncbi:MAG: hypothetical protein ACK5ZV_03895 [bacterium]